MTLEELIDTIGPGFHPDTPGTDYTSLPEGITPAMVDDVLDAAFDDDSGRVYHDTLARFIKNGWVKTSK